MSYRYASLEWDEETPAALFPESGDVVTVSTSHEARIVGTDRMVPVAAGAVVEVLNNEDEWGESRVRLSDGGSVVWVDVDDLDVPAT